MDKDSWVRYMSKIGEVIVNETEQEGETNKDKIMINENDLNREFTGKKTVISALWILKREGSARKM